MFIAGAVSAAQNETWHGGPDFQGNYSNAANWSPRNVPDNNSSTTYDVTIPAPPPGNDFHGPTVDQNATIDNLTLINRSALNAAAGISFTVLGTTTQSTTSGHAGEYAVINVGVGSTYKLGTLTNYDNSAHTLTGGYAVGFAGATDPATTLQFHGANVVTNNAFIFLAGSNANIVDQDTGLDGFRNVAVNNGTLQFVDGHNFSTAGDFTNNVELNIGGLGPNSTIFTVTGSLTNYDSATHTLTGGIYLLDGTSGSARLKFTGADIHTLNANVELMGAAAITDENGNDAFRNLSANSGSLTVSNTRTITPAGGTLGNSGSVSVNGAGQVTVSGNYQQSNGTTQVGNNTGTATMQVNGTSTISGGKIDLGGGLGPGGFQPVFGSTGGLNLGGSVVLDGTGTINADVVNSGHIAPGFSPGHITVNGALSLQNSSVLQMEIGGISAGTQFDQLVQHGDSSHLLTLGGTLQVSLINGFENSISSGDTFRIVTSDHVLQGAFINVANGARLVTSDGSGSFLVTYGNGSATPDAVKLSDFQPVPEPATSTLLCGAALLFCFLSLRRRAA